MRLLITLLTSLLLATVALLGAAIWWWSLVTTEQALTLEQRTLVIAPGTSVRGIAQQLQRQGVVPHALLFESWARLHGKGRSIKAGEYEFEDAVSVQELYAYLVAGKTVQHRLTVPEGFTVREFIARLHAEPRLRQEIDVARLDEVLREVTGEAKPEGWFFPDTYLFQRGASDLDILRQAHRQMREELDKAWAGRDLDLPLKTPYEALILASIVEKETGAAEERSLIAGVFVQRLRKSMKLQTDPTVIYGMGERYQGNIRKSDLIEDTPYNTYVHTGLPPTPIALPGREALQAVVRPAATRALYFVAKGEGKHHFSETYEQHRQAVIRYQLGGNAKRYQGGS